MWWYSGCIYMEVLLLLHNRGSILKNVRIPRKSVYCVAHRFMLPYVLCEDTTSVPCVTWSLRKCQRRYLSEAFARTPLYICSASCPHAFIRCPPTSWFIVSGKRIQSRVTVSLAVPSSLALQSTKSLVSYPDPVWWPPFYSPLLRVWAIIYFRHTCALPVIQVKENDHAKCKDY